MTSLEAQRCFFARFVSAKAGIADPRIIDAFNAIRREQFVGKGPWSIQVGDGYISTETDDPTVLYQDILVGLDVQRKINNGELSLHAKCIGTALPQPNEVVIQVGAGTGYYTAILADLVGAAGHVHAYEIDEELAMRAAQNLVQWTAVTVHRGSALEGSLPSANVICVCRRDARAFNLAGHFGGRRSPCPATNYQRGSWNYAPGNPTVGKCIRRASL